MLNFRRQKSRSSEREHVIVKPFKTIEVRLPIEVLMSQPKYKKRRDLFLQGFSAVQQRNADDPTSFYAVAGIHGLPYLPYDILPGEKEPLTDYKGEKNRWGGYCHHGDILFPTWHRPYILLLEMLIHDAAEEMIRDNPDLYPPDNNETKEYTKELEKLRFPYWDWASPSTIFQGLPSVLFDEYVHVDNPTLQNIKIRNPLRAYTLPVNLGSLTLVGDISNPTQRPYHPDGSVTPYTPAGYATVRHPSSKYITDEDATHLNVVTFCNSVFRPSLYQTFLVDKWRHFSNHGVHPDQEDEKNGHYSSIEIAHDAVHEAIGGNGGHMAYPDISAFDPIFFLHHCNVDRLLAIWQACHPNAWIEGYEFSAGTFTDDPNKKINENTNLTPFRKTADEYWTSKTVREIMKLGYTYPELPEGNEISPHQLLVETIKYYHPNEYLRYHWKLNLTVKKHKVGSPFQIRVFLDLPTASASTPKSSPNFAGLVSVFARGKETRCANCKVNPESLVNGHVDLTVCMQRLFINLNVKIEDDGSVLPNLLPNQITLIAVGKDGSDMKLEEAGLVSANYVAIDEFNNEQPEQWKVVYKNKIYPKTP